MMEHDRLDLLKRHIAVSPDADEFCKKLVIFLIDHSEELTKPVRVMVHQDKKRRRAIVFGVHDMNSSNGSTNFYKFFRKKMGIKNVRILSWANTKGDYGVGIALEDNLSYDSMAEISYDPGLIERVVLPE